MAITYTVVPGDTLGAIAKRYGTTVDQIVRDNNIQNRDLIHPGQKFVVGAGSGTSASVPKNTGMGPQQPGGMGIPRRPRNTGMGPQEAGDPDAEGVGKILSARGDHQTNPFTDSRTNKESDLAKNEAETRAKKEKTYTARATVIGDPTLKSNTLIKINNVGAKFGGHWWVKNVTHRINSSGYICDLDLQKDAIASTDGDTTGFGSPIKENPGTKRTPKNTGMGPQETEGKAPKKRIYIDARTGEKLSR